MPRTAVRMMTRDIALLTENIAELEQLYSLLEQELRPRDTLEKIYVADIVQVTWEMKRLNRAKTELIKTTFPEAVESLIKRLSPNITLSEFGLGDAPDAPRQELALDWISQSSARKKVTDFLRRFDLDDRAIEAEAVALAMPMLDKLEQTLSSLERRRWRAIGSLYLHQEAKRVAGANAGNMRRLERVPRVA